MKRAIIMLAGVLALTACDDVHIDKKIRIGDEQAKVVAPLKPAGPAATVEVVDDPLIQHAASVTEVHGLEGDAKLFGTAGGDPAMNGLYVHLAFFESPADGWKVFRVGDYLSFKVLNQAPGRVDLEVSESVMDEATGQIGSQTRRLIVGWAPGPDGAPPASVTVTPAE